MNLYKIHRPGNPPDRLLWDEVLGFVIQAPDESWARQVASRNHRDEGPDVWKDPTLSEVRMLAPMPNPLPLEEAPGNIVLTDFMSG